MNLNELLKECPQHAYYPNNEYSEELGLIDYEPTEARREWTSQTTIWMMAFALLLWLITYLMVMTLTMCFDISFRSMASFTGIHWYNGTLLASEDHSRYIIAY
ncbi:hypothetical protein B5X24_HaOG208410 [Helicoverpa armigera]|uniref:Uncharacterized protein n=1 Tax=Helicoverpa armigera TaxID=29058 RepID=A0A2W1BID1_HELAM|nr:hypothetical protein B5X24_HaOG208410 [Helicoverpa armigera]